MGIRVKSWCNSNNTQSPFFWLVMWGDLRPHSLFTSVQNSLYTFLSEKPPIFWVVFHFNFWRAGHSSCGRNFYYTTPPNICQEKIRKKLFYLFFPKLLTFGLGCGIIITSGEGNQNLLKKLLNTLITLFTPPNLNSMAYTRNSISLLAT